MRRWLPALLFAACWHTDALCAPDLVDAARQQIGVTLSYDPAYRKLAYPMGDVPMDRGVCTDVVVRAYRRLGVDLQELVHRDMQSAWPAYRRVSTWGLKRPDPNIDHRRVPNLALYFKRHGEELAVTRAADSYAPGDIVTWRLPPNLPHIGIVADVRSPDGVPLVIHNVGEGTQIENRLFAWPITGHYRFAAAGGKRP